jgi:hypothetical protein
VGAIQLSLSAVQAGFTAIEDILAFAGLMNQGSPEELREYLIGTLELADKAYTSAREAHQTFRNIRTTMYEVSVACAFANEEHPLMDFKAHSRAQPAIIDLWT